MLYPSFACILADIEKVPYFTRKPVSSKTLFHISLGQETLVARVTCFRSLSATLKPHLEQLTHDKVKKYTTSVLVDVCVRTD
ncbi:unnamed protein product [Protopolystoma xenopodis]|uniref:Selenocysteine-specific elongation factor 3rd domain-containing protein n=1 Tax=Protopolystoma xenopodis TaxID=117903 RepID=A0A3S5CRP9_9PLAT|nr:unnamed protein product [Protopolystoma xenopodis]